MTPSAEMQRNTWHVWRPRTSSTASAFAYVHGEEMGPPLSRTTTRGVDGYAARRACSSTSCDPGRSSVGAIEFVPRPRSFASPSEQ